jgi:hypothetical protein
VLSAVDDDAGDEQRQDSGDDANDQCLIHIQSSLLASRVAGSKWATCTRPTTRDFALLLIHRQSVPHPLLECAKTLHHVEHGGTEQDDKDAGEDEQDEGE